MAEGKGKPSRPPSHDEAGEVAGGLFAAARQYRKLGKKEREELAEPIGEELAPRIADSAGVHAFAVGDEKDVLTSLTVFENRGAADASVKRPAKEPRLEPEKTKVDEIPGAQAKTKR